jgi:glycosyltransferase involved in cell wall biosynthesis
MSTIIVFKKGIQMKGVWIAWENHRRNKGISKALGWKLYEIVYNDKSKLYRYIASIIKTVSIILKEKPKFVSAQNPSKVLAFVILFFKKILGYKAIIDAHNRGIFPREGKSKILMFLSQFFQKNADLTIVTNRGLKSVVEFHGGKSFILPDKLPAVPELDSKKLAGKINIAFICTFDVDEPYLEVINSARSIPDDIVIYFTGKYEGRVDIESLPSNVVLLGFVPDDAYWSLLLSVDIIIDLTLRENCLVCGAYEGVALGKPLILSDTKILRSYFRQGCIYVKPTSDLIAEGIMSAVKHKDLLEKEMTNLIIVLEKEWTNRLLKFKKLICLL